MKTKLYSFSRRALKTNPGFVGLKQAFKEKLKAEKKQKREEEDRHILSVYLELGSTRKTAKKLKMSRTNVELRIHRFSEYQNYKHVRRRNGHTIICSGCSTQFTVYRSVGAPKYCKRSCYLNSLVKTPAEIAAFKEHERTLQQARSARYLKRRKLSTSVAP